MHENSHDIVEALEAAFAHPESFNDRINPFLVQQPEATFQALVKVFDSQNAGAKTTVAEYFKGPLRSRAPGVLVPFLDDAFPDRFTWISSILSELNSVESVPRFLKFIRSRHLPVVMASMKALVCFPNPEVIDAIVTFFLDSSDEVKLSASFRVLMPIAEKLIPSLLEKFSRVEKFRQAWILKFLAETGSPSCIPVFRDSLQKSPLDLGLFGIRGLGKIGNPEAVKILESVMDHPEWFLRKRVAEALGSSKCAEAAVPLLKGLTDASVQVQASSVEALTKVGALAIPLLVKNLESGGEEMKIGLIKVIGQIRDRSFLQPLLKTLQERSTLFFSLDAVGDLGFVEAAPALEPFLKDPIWFNRLNALEAIAKLNPGNLMHLAEEKLHDPNDMVVNAASRIIAKLNS